MTRARGFIARGGWRSRAVGSNDGKLYAFDVATGKVVFEFEAGGPLSASPSVASGRLVIGSQDGKLFCLG
jgi:outer membrane protein assembly factor BamB